ncbi:putative NADH-flavin reductase [Actinoplanes octamycinicus]|uniref:Putative NADH-flavin reductase n=1 Tax=Actinoplanes octamycinicus TaxID=135948 RepID=A0A7W7H364_9ACTN|nr:NAD(P)H-binding protein [Actinoplanes octamycinicus]MBB4743052.1 putative NADH-flavin reductase [Actinoplanes octamycinicus]GIE58093.1 NAD-dependent epimerase [Actinoplanes octamycinicus]
MKITVVGAAGMSGSRIVTEALARGHRVTAVVRRAVPEARVTVVRGDATDTALMTKLFADTDVIVGATRPVPGQEHTVPATATALLDAAAATGKRILFVGGSAPLRSPGGGLAFDDPAFVPPEYRAIAAASMAQLQACRAHPADWTYVSPPGLLEPGTRTARYRRGGTALVVAADGSSRISAEDLAVAVLDELEQPSGERHFSVGY